MDPAAMLGGKDVPVALIAAAEDTLIPPARTEALRRALANIVFDRTIPQAGHNDLYEHPGFKPAFREALAQVTGGR